MANFYTVSKKINGKEYKAQFNGISAALSAIDNTYIDGTSNTSMVKMSKYVFENVIVEPAGLTADSFDDLDEFNEVMDFAQNVMKGNFREEANKKPATEKGEG